MHASTLRALVATAALFLAFSASGADEPGAAVAKPQVKVGDRWTYRITNYLTNASFTTDLRVASIGPDEIRVVSKRRDSGAESDLFYTAELNSMAAGGWTSVPHNGVFRFPLKVGASYESVFEAARQGSGIRGKVEWTVKVVGWEDITVPAGKFRALKVEAGGTYVRLDDASAPSGRSRSNYWYVPGVKRWVKSTYEDGATLSSPSTSNGNELVEFSVQ